MKDFDVLRSEVRRAMNALSNIDDTISDCKAAAGRPQPSVILAMRLGSDGDGAFVVVRCAYGAWVLCLNAEALFTAVEATCRTANPSDRAAWYATVHAQVAAALKHLGSPYADQFANFAALDPR